MENCWGLFDQKVNMHIEINNKTLFTYYIFQQTVDNESKFASVLKPVENKFSKKSVEEGTTSFEVDFQV